MTEIGEIFGYRERARAIGEPVKPVQVVKKGPPRSGKVRIRYLDGDNEGLEEWVPKMRLVCQWEEAKAFQRDERRLLRAHMSSKGAEESVSFKAAEWVFSAVSTMFGEEMILSGWKVFERSLVIIRDFANSTRTLQLDAEQLLAEPYAFVDRYGDYKAPAPVAERLAKLFCQRFPKEILRHVQADEQRWWQEMTTCSDSFEEDFYRKWLDKHKPMGLLIREWCGEHATAEFDEITELQKEILRLRTLVQSTADWLREAGHPVKASALLKQLDSPQYASGPALDTSQALQPDGPTSTPLRDTKPRNRQSDANPRDACR